MPYVYYYLSEEPPAGATWSVYSELYEQREDDEPIDGSQRLVASAQTRGRADELIQSLTRRGPKFVIREEEFG